jgi:hypothetical protein
VIGILYILLFFAGLIVAATAIYQLRLLRHKGISREAFIQEFLKLEIPETIPAAVYDFYKSSALWKGFSVSSQDRFEDLFSAAPEDIADDAGELLRRLGLAMPIEPVLVQWNAPLRTLDDMVRWLNWIRQHQ